MLILLPPSETKASGGTGPPLDLAGLSFPSLSPIRERLLAELQTLSGDPAAAMTALDLGPRQADELERNRELSSSPTAPAIERYTGVLYEALDYRTLRAVERRRADGRLLIASALFGLVRAGDPIPAYRLSGGSRLPGVGGLQSLWKPALGPLLERLAAEELVVDLRSGAYTDLAPLRDAVSVRVLSERADGTRGVISHANKTTKGLLARYLARSSRECTTAREVVTVARRAGLVVEPRGRTLDVIVGR